MRGFPYFCSPPPLEGSGHCHPQAPPMGSRGQRKQVSENKSSQPADPAPQRRPPARPFPVWRGTWKSISTITKTHPSQPRLCRLPFPPLSPPRRLLPNTQYREPKVTYQALVLLGVRLTELQDSAHTHTHASTCATPRPRAGNRPLAGQPTMDPEPALSTQAQPIAHPTPPAQGAQGQALTALEPFSIASTPSRPSVASPSVPSSVRKKGYQPDSTREQKHWPSLGPPLTII